MWDVSVDSTITDRGGRGAGGPADKAYSSLASGRPPSVDRDVHKQRHAVERGINTWLRHI